MTKKELLEFLEPFPDDILILRADSEEDLLKVNKIYSSPVTYDTRWKSYMSGTVDSPGCIQIKAITIY